jgi:hypothetical protein
MSPQTERMMTPQERAESARRRILQGVENLGRRHGALCGRTDRLPFSAVAFALLGGFVIGYWPQANCLLMRNITGLLRFLINLKL